MKPRTRVCRGTKASSQDSAPWPSGPLPTRSPPNSVQATAVRTEGRWVGQECSLAAGHRGPSASWGPHGGLCWLHRGRQSPRLGQGWVGSKQSALGAVSKGHRDDPLRTATSHLRGHGQDRFGNMCGRALALQGAPTVSLGILWSQLSDVRAPWGVLASRAVLVISVPLETQQGPRSRRRWGRGAFPAASPGLPAVRLCSAAKTGRQTSRKKNNKTFLQPQKWFFLVPFFLARVQG